jgi:lysozyme
MRALKSSPGLVLAACSALVLSASLAGCNSGLDSSFEGRSPRFATSAPLKNAKKDPDFLAYAVPETDLHLYPASRSGEYAVHGVDVSKYQGDIDWTAVKDSGVAFAFIKASEGGDSVDSKFQRNWALAKAAGVPRGAYHFVYWCRPPQEEIANFKSVVPVEADALPPVLDLEATPESRSCKRTLNREEVLPDLRKMLEALEAHYGKRPIIYTSVDFYQAILHSDALAEYPIWVRSTKYHPAVRYGSRNWTFWQYRSDGAVPGIPGNVDQNAFRGTHAEWEKWLAAQTRS